MKVRNSQPHHGKALSAILGLETIRRGRHTRVIVSWIPVQNAPCWVLAPMRNREYCSGVPVSHALRELYENRAPAEKAKLKRA